MAERIFGTYIINSDNKEVSVRDIAENHILEDLGFIPTIETWLKNMEIEKWMSGSVKKTKIIPLD